jgi:hypothetical protein
MAYATPSDLRLQIGKISTVSDGDLTTILSAAERNINRAVNRPDGFEAVVAATTRTYSGSGKPYQFVDECISITTVAVKDSATDTTYDTWNAADWIACSGDPKYPDFNNLPYDLILVDATGDESIFTSGRYTVRGGFRPTSSVSRGVPTVQITARWGYSATAPDDIHEACIMQAARWFKRLEGAMSDALATGELGTLLYRQSLDPDIKRLLVDGRYVKPTTGRR